MRRSPCCGPLVRVAYAVAGVGRLDRGIDVANVVAPAADGPVVGVAVVDVEVVRASTTSVDPVGVPGVGVGVEAIVVTVAVYGVALSVANPLVEIGRAHV